MYYQLLPAHYVAIHSQRGVKVRGLWYDGPALDDYRHGPSARGGRHKNKWVIRRDPRDARTVFFQDPRTHDWHPLRWTGLPPDGEVPSFSDARVADLLAAARQAGLRPRSDAELLPLLLDLIGARIPVDAWPTQMSKTERTTHARDAERARAADADRPSRDLDTAGTPVAALPMAPSAKRHAGSGTAASWPEHARRTAHAVDDDRRRRRDEAVDGQPITPPGRLGDAFRRRNLFLLPDDNDTDETDADETDADPADIHGAPFGGEPGTAS